MFERYTEKARRVIFFSRYEAIQFGSPNIESEHLLLGYLRENKITKFPSTQGLTADSIRQQIETHSKREKIPMSVDLPLTLECKRILHYASEEADRLKHKHIGTEHVLAGMLLEENCYAARLLTEHGVSLEMVRSSMSEEPTSELARTKSPGIPAGYRWKTLLYNPVSESIVVEVAQTDTGHLPMSRLFTRHKDAALYEIIGSLSEDLSYESPVTCEKQPIVIFNSVKWAGGGGTPDGVYSFNLHTKELTVCIAKDTLRVPEPHLRSWITTLVSLSHDGQILYLKVGIEKSVGSAIQYYLGSVALPGNNFEILSVLKDTRF